MRFALYVAWRLLRGLFYVVTGPVWVPVLFVVVGLYTMGEEIATWYQQVKYDYERRRS